MTNIPETPAPIITHVKKRDGQLAPYDKSKIVNAIFRCLNSPDVTSNRALATIPDLADAALALLQGRILLERVKNPPTVEDIQDCVEVALQSAGEYDGAKHYILYRQRHAEEREQRPVPPEVKSAFEESKMYLPNPVQEFQFYDKYSRWDWEKMRRETWPETVDRVILYLKELAGDGHSDALRPTIWDEVRQAILKQEVIPSMRLMATAGEAARRNNISIYNCAYLPIRDLEAYKEILFISMHGVGVGYSVEQCYVEQLPRIKRQRGRAPLDFTVEDTTEGWASAVIFGLEKWFDGYDVNFNLDGLRPAGSLLRTKGGRSSGPEPLRRMLRFYRQTILNRQGSVLRTIDAHDMACYAGTAGEAGGHRRAALLSLYTWGDNDMRSAKSGDWITTAPWRYLANNSEVWPDEGLDQLQLINLMRDMYKGMSGEPGIFNRRALMDTMPQRRKDNWPASHDGHSQADENIGISRGNSYPSRFHGDNLCGINPCGEIILRPYEFCNLTAAVCRAGDDERTLREKVRLATFIGTVQAKATYFPGIREDWARNCQQEQLLGVDLTGQMDCELARDIKVKERLKESSLFFNKYYSELLGTNPSMAITTCKPNGNSATFLNCSEGIHARHSKFYKRQAIVGVHTGVFKVLQDAGVPMEPKMNTETGKIDTSEWVVSFPIASPPGAIVKKELTALQQLKNWRDNKLHWTEHNPSCSITYMPHELIDIIQWLWDNKNKVGGLTFYPYYDAVYVQAPFIEISEEEYQKMKDSFPVIDFSKLFRYEKDDYTKAAQELACFSGSCEVMI